MFLYVILDLLIKYKISLSLIIFEAELLIRIYLKRVFLLIDLILRLVIVHTIPFLFLFAVITVIIYSIRIFLIEIQIFNTILITQLFCMIVVGCKVNVLSWRSLDILFRGFIGFYKCRLASLMVIRMILMTIFIDKFRKLVSEIAYLIFQMGKSIIWHTFLL